MLRINAIPNTGAAKAYYSQSDYYIDGEQHHAQWHGKGADLLGLTGDIDQERFEALCENLNPRTGKQLTAKHLQNRRVGYDFTWSLPKSVSVAATLGLDDRLPDAFRGAVADTMALMEGEMETRVRKGGRNENRRTGNMLWADFLHSTSRPINGQPDPQLHVHAVVFNATFDREEGQWKAGEFAHLKANAPYYQAVFRSRLADRLQGLGYEVRRTKGDFELVGVPDRVIREYSRRTAQVEKAAELLGVKKPETKAKLGATTREAKTKGHSWGDLLRLWQDRLRPGEMEAIRGAVAAATKPVKPKDMSREAVDFALEHLLERSSVVSQRKVVTEALKWGVGSVTPESVYAELGRRKDVIRREVGGVTMVSTSAVLGEERGIIAFAERGRGKFRPLARPIVDREQNDLATLSPSQQAAIQHAWESHDQVIVIRGLAGTGKTTLTKALLAGVNLPTVVLAPSAEASRGVLRREGFEHADTLAAFQNREELQQRAKNGLIVLDEASLAGAKDVALLFKSAARLNARVLMLGDRRQHKSVARGDVLALLEDKAKLPVAEVGDIKRQAGEYKQAVEALAKGDTAGGFRQLDRLGWVKEADHIGDATNMIAADYLTAVRAGKSVLVVSPTHAEGEKVTAEIRARLREEGLLKGEDRTLRRLVPLNLTKPEMLEARKAPEPGVVVERFAAYREAEQPVAVGDQMRTTAGIKDCAGRRIDNGSMLTVTGFTSTGRLKVKTASGQDRLLEADAGHLAHGYVATSHAAQGKTVDVVLIQQGRESFPASGKEQLYVSVSRGRQRATIYTEDKDALLAAVQKEDGRVHASDLVRERTGRIRIRLKKHLAFIRRVGSLRREQDRQPERGITYEHELAR